MTVRSIPLAPITELGLTAIVGADNQIDQYDFSASIEIPVGIGGLPVSGELLSLMLRTTETGTGAIMTPAGTLVLFDADPAVTAGDTALTAAEWGTALGAVDILAADWISDANGGLVFKSIAIPFHELTSLWAVWYHTDATSLNSAAGDDEAMHFNLWYRRDS